MIVKTHDVFCDVGGPSCEVWCSGASTTDSQGGARAARRVARVHHGWIRTGNRDICSGCKRLTDGYPFGVDDPDADLAGERSRLLHSTET